VAISTKMGNACASVPILTVNWTVSPWVSVLDHGMLLIFHTITGLQLVTEWSLQRCNAILMIKQAPPVDSDVIIPELTQHLALWR